MTTAVTVDAHAGWNIEVVVQSLDNEGNVTEERTEVVERLTTKVFYIHSHMQLARIKELKQGG
jgi:hypothetical protein